MNQAVALGIDLGGTTIKIGVYTESWTLLDCVSIKTRVADGPEAVIRDMAAVVSKLLVLHHFRPSAIGLGSPGPLDLAQGKLLTLPNFPGWDFFPIREALERAAGIPVILESDGNTAALAEFKMGAGRETGLNSLCMWTLGTGVGSGLIIESNIWHGRDGMAGELGHVCIDPGGPPCACGSQGCLERFASATAITEAGRRWLQANNSSGQMQDEEIHSFTTKDFASMANEMHSGMKAIFDNVGYSLGLSIASVINTLDLPLYIIGGGVADAWDLFASALFKSVAKHSYLYRLNCSSQKGDFASGLPLITRATLGAEAGLLGAALITDNRHALKSPACFVRSD